MKNILYLLVLLFPISFVSAQNKVEEALQKLEKYPQEKVYILFSKDNYVVGETMWFKAVVFDGYNRSAISTSLFVELYSANKSQVSKKIIPLFDGEGSGSFAIPDSLKEGSYFIRAYTQWMLNFSEAFQYVRPIAIYNPASPQKLVADTMAAWTAAIFPEGGTLIEGNNSKVAVRLTSDGIPPADWNGYVVDVAKPAEKIVSFTGFDRNVGLFNIIPEKGKQYQVIVQDKKGKKQTIFLPKAAASGVSLQVNSTPENIFYSLKFIDIPSGSKGYKIIGTINNVMVYKAAINKISPEITSSIPTEKLINGILRLTVFDENENAVAQRLCFIQPEQLKVGRPAFPPLYLSKASRGLNAFDIAPDTNYMSYTVLVRDGNVKDNAEDDNILSTLWLSGDIAGKIYAPGRYLTYDANTAALDALLISEKWSRFDWASIIAGKFPEINYKPEPYIAYKGKVTTNGGRPAANSTVNLIFYFQDSTNQINQVETDASGNFVLENLIFEEPMKVYYQLNNDKKGTAAARETNIIFEPLYMYVPYKSALPSSGYALVKRPANDPVSAEIARSIANRNNQKSTNEKFKTLAEVKITASKKSEKEKLNEQLSSGMFRSMNENVFDFVNENQDAQAYTNVLQWLQGRVAGLQIQMQNGDYIPTIRGSRVGIYLDEMQADPSQISSLPIADIALVKVIKGPFVGGVGGGGGGAVAIYTRRGNTQRANSKQPPALNSFTMTGYDKMTPFYTPDYKESNFKSIDKDTRDALFWGPLLIAERNKPVTVRFYNNDDAKSFKVTIIGFSKQDDMPLYYNDIFK